MKSENDRERVGVSNDGLIVVVDSLNVEASRIIPFVKRILEVTDKSGYDAQILLAMHGGLDPENSKSVDRAIKEEFPGTADSVIVNKNTFAYAYLKGLETAMKMGGDKAKIIEIDSGGGHKPEQITRFISALGENQVVLSSRFIKGGEHKYPFQRRLISKTATVLSNLFLGTNLSDASSGFQGFKGNVLKEIFKAVPPEEWVSAVHGPFHMYQTEMRAYLSWGRYQYGETPISYGLEKQGKPLPAGYLFQCLVCFLRILSEKPSVEEKLRHEASITQDHS